MVCPKTPRQDGCVFVGKHFLGRPSEKKKRENYLPFLSPVPIKLVDGDSRFRGRVTRDPERAMVPAVVQVSCGKR
jgi:hypothetical protein